MIYAEYRNDETSKLFHIKFANTELSDTDFKPINATYHLENAINKAFDSISRPTTFILEINDPHNYYLKLIAIAFVAYVRGLGFAYPEVKTINF